MTKYRIPTLVAALLLGVAAFAEPTTSGTLTVEPPAAPSTEMSFNFRGVPIEDVLDAMSRNLGLTVVRAAAPTGNVDVVSHHPLSAADAVQTLNTVLYEKGYAGILKGKTLTIVKRDEARQRNLPVRRGSDPEQIPDNSEMVTQIIPLRQASVKEIVEDLQPLVPSYATMTANESSNALVLTDTQSGVRHIAEIVAALDGSIADISSLKVYPLDYADAKSVAETVTKVFEQPTSSSSNRNNNGGGPFGGRGFFRPPGEGGGNNNNTQSDSAALKAASRVVAVADERTNSLIVSAPDNLLPVIEELVQSIDHSTDVLTDVRVFPLQYGNATEMATLITSIFSPDAAKAASSQNNRQNRRFGGGFPFGGQQAQTTQTQSSRATAESTVLAVADTRTNSLVVSAIPSTMEEVARVIKGLDANPSKTKRVYVYPLKNADPEEVSTMLEGMFGSGASSTNRSSTTRNSNSTNRSSNRSSNNTNSTRNSSGSTSRN